MKKILLIVATHGDEKIGIEVIENLNRKKLGKYFDFLIANPKALKKDVRYIDIDLNRSYPGKDDSLLYEEKLATRNLKLAKKYKYVIDLHEASQGRDDFIIVPRPKLSDFQFGFIDLDIILLWPDPKGPLGNILSNVIELEFGAKERKRKDMIIKATNIIELFIMRIYERAIKENKLKEIYLVYGKLTQKDFIDKTCLIDFRETEIKGEKFFPLLTNQYIDEGIICYKMKRLL